MTAEGGLEGLRRELALPHRPLRRSVSVPASKKAAQYISINFRLNKNAFFISPDGGEHPLLDVRHGREDDDSLCRRPNLARHPRLADVAGWRDAGLADNSLMKGNKLWLQSIRWPADLLRERHMLTTNLNLR